MRKCWVLAGADWVNLEQVLYVEALPPEEAEWESVPAVELTFAAEEGGLPLRRTFAGPAARAIEAALRRLAVPEEPPFSYETGYAGDEDE